MNSRRNYFLLLSSQALSAFGDNMLLTLILGPLLARLDSGKITAADQSIANIYYTSLLFVPYVLLAPVAGYLNDRFSKNRCLFAGNFIKLLGTGLVALGVRQGSGWQAVGYFVVGIGACFYSPAKYGILPEIVPQARLVKANGSVELLTLVAILAGNLVGAKAFDQYSLAVCYAVVFAIYGFSLILNWLMTRTPFYPSVQLKSSVGEFFFNLREIFGQKRLARILVGTSLFWVCGAILKMNFQPWGQQVLHMTSMLQIALFGLWLSVGVMIGSVAAGQLYVVGDLHATRRYGWLLAGGVGVLGSVGWLWRHNVHVPFMVQIFLTITGVIAGLFLIPLNAALQAESHKDKLGKTIATQNGLENCAMLCGSLLALADVKVGFNPSELFVGLAIFVALAVTWLKIPAHA